MEPNIEKILKETRIVAIIGASKDRTKPSRTIMRYLMRHGYRCYPVNPSADNIGGIKSYKNILEIPDEIDMADIFLPSEKVIEVVMDKCTMIEHLKLRKKGSIVSAPVLENIPEGL